MTPTPDHPGWARLLRAVQIHGMAEHVLAAAMHGRTTIDRCPTHPLVADEIAAAVVDLGLVYGQHVDLIDNGNGWTIELTPIVADEIPAPPPGDGSNSTAATATPDKARHHVRGGRPTLDTRLVVDGVHLGDIHHDIDIGAEVRVDHPEHLTLAVTVDGRIRLCLGTIAAAAWLTTQHITDTQGVHP